MFRIVSTSEEMTSALGRALGAGLQEGDVLLLHGEMGAGKSVLTRAMARGMGIDEPIPSPTFTILMIHEGPGLSLYHFDLYRLESEDELFAMGLEEMIPPDGGAAVIEWPEQAGTFLERRGLNIYLSYDSQNPETRIIEIHPADDAQEQHLSAILMQAGF